MFFFMLHATNAYMCVWLSTGLEDIYNLGRSSMSNLGKKRVTGNQRGRHACHALFGGVPIPRQRPAFSASKGHRRCPGAGLYTQHHRCRPLGGH